MPPMSWMQRLKRVFAIDIETCPHGGGKLRVIACVEDRPLIGGTEPLKSPLLAYFVEKLPFADSRALLRKDCLTKTMG